MGEFSRSGLYRAETIIYEQVLASTSPTVYFLYMPNINKMTQLITVIEMCYLCHRFHAVAPKLNSRQSRQHRLPFPSQHPHAQVEPPAT